MSLSVVFRSLLLMCFLVLGTGCGGDNAFSPTVRIVNLSDEAVRRPLSWMIGTIPDLQIGSAGSIGGDSLSAFWHVGGVVQFPNGNIAVHDTRAGQLRYYDPQGNFLRTVSRRGPGPEEFGTPVIVPDTRYDSLIISDARNRRVTVLSTMGTVKSARSVNPGTDQAITFLPGDRLVGRTIKFRGSRSEGIGFHGVTFAVMSLTTGIADTVVSDSIAYVRALDPSGQFQSTDAAFTVYPSAAGTRDRLYIIPGPAPEIRVHDSKGRLNTIIKVPGLLRPLPRSRVDSARESFIRTTASEAGTRNLYNSLPAPGTYPVWQRVLIDGAGILWAQEYGTTPAQATRWHLFKDDNSALGTMITPEGLDVMHIAPNFILGVWRDESGINYVRRYSLIRTAG